MTSIYSLSPNVVLTYKDVSATACHAGLGVTALNIAKGLSEAGIHARPLPVRDGYVLSEHLRKSPAITDVVMLAPWIDTGYLRSMTAEFRDVQFTVTSHSNLGFLQVDPWSVKVILEQMDLERDRLNFRVSGNCLPFCRWVEAAHNRPCAYLPNLFHAPRAPVFKPLWTSGPLRIGIFGATRVLKNIGTGVAAALVIAKQLGTETEIWMSGGREEGGKGVRSACAAMLANSPHVRIVDSPWQTWAQFGATVSRMNLLLQPSFTESFNNVTADGVTHGVPSVVGPAIAWTPRSWQANPDDAVDLARTGMRLLKDRAAAARGLKALRAYNEAAVKSWKAYLNGSRLANFTTIGN